jgi:Bacterial antitoxin of type II TA system, VapB
VRTTVVLKDDLVKKAKKLAGETTLSALLNNCLADWIAQHSARELKSRLIDEYRAARKESRRVSRDFARIDDEGWPSW